MRPWAQMVTGIELERRGLEDVPRSAAHRTEATRTMSIRSWRDNVETLAAISAIAASSALRSRRGNPARGNSYMKMCPVPSGPDQSGSPQTRPLLIPTHTQSFVRLDRLLRRRRRFLERGIHFDDELIEKEAACRLVQPRERRRPAETLEQRGARASVAQRSRHEDQAVERQVNARQRVGVREAGEDLHVASRLGGLTAVTNDSAREASSIARQIRVRAARERPNSAEADPGRDARNRGGALWCRRPLREGFTRDAAAVLEAAARDSEPAHGRALRRLCRQTSNTATQDWQRPDEPVGSRRILSGARASLPKRRVA